MKTNITMRSEVDRELYGVIIKQDTKNSFLSLTDLQEAYTRARVLNGWSDYRIADVFDSRRTHERIYYLLESCNYTKTGFPAFMQMIAEKGIVATLKELGAYVTKGRGENRLVMCDPYIWTLVAMELNPQVYAKVVMWLTDKLILNRIEVGDYYIKLGEVLKTVPDVDYAIIGKQLNIAVFGRHEIGIRNTVGQEELEELRRLEDNLAFAIEQGYLKTMGDILKAISEYRKRKQNLLST